MQGIFGIPVTSFALCIYLCVFVCMCATMKTMVKVASTLALDGCGGVICQLRHMKQCQ